MSESTEGEKAKAEARERLLQGLPHFRYAMAQAKEEGKAKVGILAVQPNGSGQVKASFEADSFFDDLALVLDAPPQSEEDDTEAAAGELLDKFFPRKKV